MMQLLDVALTPKRTWKVQRSHVPAEQKIIPQLQIGSPMMHASPGLIWHAAHQQPIDLSAFSGPGLTGRTDRQICSVRRFDV